MPDSTRGLSLRRTADITTAGAHVLTDPQQTRSLWNYETWQGEAWDFWRNLGEFSSGIDWLKSSMSRVRLVAAEMVPGQKDPAFLSPEDVRGNRSATAALALAQVFAGGTAGQSQIMSAGAVQLGVPGEGILVVERASEQIPLAFADWQILSKDAVRTSTVNGQPWWEIRTGDTTWRPMAEEALPTRIMEPDAQFPWRSHSAARPALPIMRTMDLLNRRIISTLVSRIGMNGLLAIPQEALVKVPEQYKGNPNWFVQKLIDAAMNNIRNPGSAGAALPQIIDFPAEQIDKIKHIIISDGITKELIEEREAETKRLAVTLTMPIEALLGYGDMNHWCQPEDTEILTRSGWRTHDQINVGDIVMTLNHETGQSEWQPVQDIYRADVTDEPMMRIAGKFHDSLSTMAHRWPVIRNGVPTWTTAAELQPLDQIIRAAPAADLPTEAKYTDDFVELVGWFITEGTCTWPTPTHSQVRIGQSHQANPAMVARIRGVLARLFGPASETMKVAGEGRTSVVPRWREVAEERGMTLFHLNKAAYAPLLNEMESWHSKTVTRDFIYSLTRAQLELFLNVFALGDGSINATGGLTIDQRDPARLAPIELAAILAGRPVRTHVHTTGGFDRKPQTFLSVNSRYRHVAIRKTASMETYTGVVWCPTTPNHSWLARRNGHVYFTGNSGWLTNETGIKLYISPKAELLVTGFTKGVMHPILQAMGLDLVGPRGGQLCFWYDASDLIARPDKSAEARELYDRRELSGKSMRAANGFDEDDRPDDEELQDMVLKGMSKDTTNGPMALTSLTGWEPPAGTQTSAVGDTTNRPEGTPAVTSGPSPAAGTPTTQGASRPAETSPVTASIGAAVRRQLGAPAETREMVGVRR
jgi:hypothetical protein